MPWSLIWTSRPLIPCDNQISITATGTQFRIAYERKPSGPLNNCACKPADESKRSSAFSIDRSSSRRQILPSTRGKTKGSTCMLRNQRAKRRAIETRSPAAAKEPVINAKSSIGSINALASILFWRFRSGRAKKPLSIALLCYLLGLCVDIRP
jgi:hypothetical protein